MLRRDESSTPQQAGLNLTLRFRDLILYGVILIQPPAPHVVTPSGTYNIRLYVTDPHEGTVKSLPFTLPVTVK